MATPMYARLPRDIRVGDIIRNRNCGACLRRRVRGRKLWREVKTEKKTHKFYEIKTAWLDPAQYPHGHLKKSKRITWVADRLWFPVVYLPEATQEVRDAHREWKSAIRSVAQLEAYAFNKAQKEVPFPHWSVPYNAEKWDALCDRQRELRAKYRQEKLIKEAVAREKRTKRAFLKAVDN